MKTPRMWVRATVGDIRWETGGKKSCETVSFRKYPSIFFHLEGRKTCMSHVPLALLGVEAVTPPPPTNLSMRGEEFIPPPVLPLGRSLILFGKATNCMIPGRHPQFHSHFQLRRSQRASILLPAGRAGLTGLAVSRCEAARAGLTGLGVSRCEAARAGLTGLGVSRCEAARAWQVWMSAGVRLPGPDRSGSQQVWGYPGLTGLGVSRCEATRAWQVWVSAGVRLPGLGWQAWVSAGVRLPDPGWQFLLQRKYMMKEDMEDDDE